MGCGSSNQRLVEEGNGNIASGKHGRPVIEDEDIPTEILPESPPPQVKPPLAFEISFDGPNIKESLIEGPKGLVHQYPPKPPKRLQRLHQSENQPSLQELQDKLESAEKRRLEILQSRVASASKTTRKMMNAMRNNNDPDTPIPKKKDFKNSIEIEGKGLSL